MKMFERILIDVDALADDHPALNQGLDLAARSGSEVLIVDVLPDVPPAAVRVLGARIEEELVEHRRGRLTAIGAVHRTPVRVETRLLRGKPAVAVVHEVLRRRCDLVIRSHGRDLSETPAFGPVDLQLLRTCPCPVWLVAPGSATPPRRLLAPVDVSDPGTESTALNQAIVDLAAAISDLERGDLTVLHVWQLFGRSLLESHMSRPELDEYVAAAARDAERTFDTFKASLGDRQARTRFEILEGEPHRVIADLAAQRPFDLVVMGTAARTGVAGLLMGNTAERVLRDLRGSVLAVKPPGFVSPITLDATGAPPSAGTPR
jgi:nucleotide-binding universal stress UspA family protein